MSKKQKLIARLKSKPKDFTFIEAETLLESLGFEKSNKGKTSGSKVIFSRGVLEIEIHRPHPRKELKPYVINRMLKILEREGLI